MGSLIEKIDSDLVAALKSKDAIKVSTLRLLKSSIKNRSIAKSKELSDDDLIDVVSSEAKKRKEAIDSYTNGHREDLAAKETAELKILKGYLPEELGEEELKNIIKQVISDTGASGPKDTGKVMKEVMPRTKGRADGKTINQLVRDILQGS